MKLLLTGTFGLLGHTLASTFLDAGWTVHASAHLRPPNDTRLRLHKVDLTRVNHLGTLLESIQPDTIVNAAAYTIPAQCAKQPSLSRALNVGLPIELAYYSTHSRIRFIHFSTDMVFDWRQRNYTPEIPANPTCLYGEHELESETRIQELHPESCTVRLPLLMGNSLTGTRSVHEALWNVWSQGLFHWDGSTHLNRWEMGNLIADKLGVPTNLLQYTLVRNFSQLKDRPLNLTMDSSKLKALVQTEPAPFEIQLEELQVPRTKH